MVDSLTQMGMIPTDSEIMYSRIVRATVGQILEIPYRGSGWVYLGELASRRGIVYNSRRNDPDGLSFIFTLEEAGTYALKFYRQDFIRDFIINDHVQVIVGEAPSSGAAWFGPPQERSRIVAQPRWPSAMEEAQIRSGARPTGEPVVSGAPPQAAASAQAATPAPVTSAPTAPAAVPEAAVTAAVPPAPPLPPPVMTSTPATPSVVTAPPVITPPTEERLSPDSVMQRAQQLFEAGNTTSAIALLDQFMLEYPGGSDEAYWLLGQFYEANTPSRNILLSLDYYNRLVNEYPQSRRLTEARRRIAYLERFYINIR
ncbi:MAG: tetratricopeptide repeat protein [Treponema sp.]|nr:tetratricopeptide repeat protein [Treponema sp.]